MRTMQLRNHKSLSYLMYVPVDLSEKHMQFAHTMIGAACRRAEKLGSAPFVDLPDKVLYPDADILESESKLRRENIQNILEGRFSEIWIAGSGMCEYARSIVWAAYHARRAHHIAVYDHTMRASLLARYVEWHKNAVDA